MGMKPRTKKIVEKLVRDLRDLGYPPGYEPVSLVVRRKDLRVLADGGSNEHTIRQAKARMKALEEQDEL